MKCTIVMLPVAFGLVVSCGCAKRMAAPPPPPAPESIVSDDTAGGSLFKGDQAVLSDQDIARILGTQLDFHDRHRLAILNLGSTHAWSEDLAEAEAKNLDDLVSSLKSSRLFTAVRLLPALLVPEKHTIPYLREAAARIQADLLFVYTTRIQYFRRDRFLKAEEVHAQCVAESVLLDVRTGIVIHTDHASESIAAKKTPGDLVFDETVARAQSEAKGKAVLSLANAITAYLAEQEKANAGSN